MLQGQESQISSDTPLPERIDGAIQQLMEKEFNELFNEIKSYKLQLQSKFGLLTEDHLIFYNDIYMLNEAARFHVSGLDFVDLGIVLQNNQVNKRVFFIKVVYQNV